MGNYCSILVLYRDNGKEDGNHCIIIGYILGYSRGEFGLFRIYGIQWQLSVVFYVSSLGDLLGSGFRA